MKKWLLYSAACFIIGTVWMLCSGGVMHVDSSSVVTVEPIEQTSDNVQIIQVSDIHSVIEELEFADDVNIQYTHSLCINDILYEVDYVGSSYNYKLGKGHVSAIHPDLIVDCYYDEDSYLISIGDEGFKSDEDTVEVGNKEIKYLSSNLSTINMIVDVIQHSDKTRVTEVSGGTLYALTTYDSVHNGELLQPVEGTGVECVNWEVYVSNNEEPSVAKLTIKSCENDQGIAYEQFSYKFRTNTGYTVSFPDLDYKRGNMYEDFTANESAAG